MESLNNPKNIVGLASLIKDNDISSEKDLHQIEKEIVQGTFALENKSEINPADEFEREMEKLNMNLESYEGKQDSHTIPQIDTRSQRSNSVASHEDNKSELVHNDEDDNFSSYRYHTKKPIDRTYQRVTDEERRQDHIHDVLRELDASPVEGFSVEKEKEEDDKIALLEQIDMLRQILDDDGIDVSRVPDVCNSSPMKDIQNVCKILRLKNDRNRLCSLAEEGVLLAAAGLEFVFDGKKEYFGFQPDLVGWSETVKVKLRRMRYETSSFVSEVMKDYKISAGTRLFLELVPSMFLYSRSKQQQCSNVTVSDSSYKTAISQLNNMR